MRLLILLLLLANIGAFWWFSRQMPPAQASLPPLPDTAQRLILLSERQATPPVLASASGQQAHTRAMLEPTAPQALADWHWTAPDTAASALLLSKLNRTAQQSLNWLAQARLVQEPRPWEVRCYRSEAQPEPSMAAAEQAWLQGHGLSATLSEGKQRLQTGTWVYLPPFPSRRAARQAERHLQRDGFEQHMLVTGKELHNAVSLGVYQDLQQARQLLQELRDKGYAQAETRPRYRYQTAYWVEFEVSQPKQMNILQSFADAFKVRVPSQVACKSVAIAAEIP